MIAVMGLVFSANARTGNIQLRCGATISYRITTTDTQRGSFVTVYVTNNSSRNVNVIVNANVDGVGCGGSQNVAANARNTPVRFGCNVIVRSSDVVVSAF